MFEMVGKIYSKWHSNVLQLQMELKHEKLGSWLHIKADGRTFVCLTRSRLTIASGPSCILGRVTANGYAVMTNALFETSILLFCPWLTSRSCVEPEIFECDKDLWVWYLMTFYWLGVCFLPKVIKYRKCHQMPIKSAIWHTIQGTMPASLPPPKKPNS